MVKLKETKIDGGGAPPVLAPTTQSETEVKSRVTPATVTAKEIKGASQTDVSEVVVPDPSTLDESQKKTAIKRLRQSPLASVIDNALEKHGTPLMPQYLGMQLVRQFG